MRFYGLIGRALSHSYSKLIHSEMGCSSYQHVELEPNELEGFFKEREIGGMNVTIPYKKDVLPYLDELSDDAREIGCVNTIIYDGEKLVGHNTDAFGFLWMAKNANIELENKKVIILGSGGAQLAVKRGAELAKAREIVTISRSGENNYDNLHLHYDAEVIVNATPVGMYPECNGQPIDLSPFTNCKGVLDLIYNPFKTNLLVQAEQKGIPYSNGLSMLVAQAKKAEEYFGNDKLTDDDISRIMKIIAQKTRNIILIGMPGCGKSTVGKALGALTGKEVIDIDSEIEKTAGTSIPEIFATKGEAEFRRLENAEIIKACGGFGRIIITGGGAVKTEANYLPLKRCGRIYHLERDVNLLSRDNRPLSQGSDLNLMYAQRLPMYERFRDIRIDLAENAENTAEIIWRDFCENSCN